MCGKEHYDENFSHHCTKVRHITIFSKKSFKEKRQRTIILHLRH